MLWCGRGCGGMREGAAREVEVELDDESGESESGSGVDEVVEGV